MNKDDLPKIIVLFDGECNTCNFFVDFLLRRKNREKFRFASLQSEVGKRLLAKHGVNPSETDSVVCIVEAKVFLYSDAVVRVFRELEFPFNLGALISVIPRFLRDKLYKIFAKNRYRIFGKRESCRILTAQEKALFAEDC